MEGEGGDGGDEEGERGKSGEEGRMKEKFISYNCLGICHNYSK